jgi:hypothetical protein
MVVVAHFPNPRAAGLMKFECRTQFEDAYEIEQVCMRLFTFGKKVEVVGRIRQ